MALPVNAGDATHQEAPLEPAANRSPPDPIEADRLRTHLATTVGHPCAGSTPASGPITTSTPRHHPATLPGTGSTRRPLPRVGLTTDRHPDVGSCTSPIHAPAGSPSTRTATTHSVRSSTDRRTPRGCSPLPPPSLFFFSLHTSGMARGVVIDGFIC